MFCPDLFFVWYRLGSSMLLSARLCHITFPHSHLISWTYNDYSCFVHGCYFHFTIGQWCLFLKVSSLFTPPRYKSIFILYLISTYFHMLVYRVHSLISRFLVFTQVWLFTRIFTHFTFIIYPLHSFSSHLSVNSMWIYWSYKRNVGVRPSTLV
ncbi:hypothetical protein BDP27DRAFT_650531 [Rhodocollybia butyracea]|uniref:Uncharacterized protein n=1 Tax=Rhodocollybia butyracea TaxID=206335 RepID=A0A9P5TXA8_9AGAR|nr:hypothetical protein BDP27DRAFT_650531 [Rhodocollybia butyracea]